MHAQVKVAILFTINGEEQKNVAQYEVDFFREERLSCIYFM